MSTNVLTILGITLGSIVLAEFIRIGWYLRISKRLTTAIKKFERIDPTAPRKILFIGDSVGHGSGASKQCYSIVARMGAHIPEAHIENESESGRKLSGATRLLKARANSGDSKQYDLVILMVGGMNLVHGTPIALVRRLLARAAAYGKQCAREVVLIAPNNTGLVPLFRFPLDRLYQRRARLFDAVYRDIAAQENVRSVSLFQEHADVLSSRNLYASDKTHPNDEGYGLWYDQIKGTILDALKNHDGETLR